MDLELKKIPGKPEFNNSAGRLLGLLEMVQESKSYFDIAAGFYSGADKSNDLKARAFVQFAMILGKAYDEFFVELEMSDKLPDATRTMIKEGLAKIVHIAFPVNSSSQPTLLEPAEIAVLKMAASLLGNEDELLESDEQKIRDSIEELRKLTEESNLSKSARTAILELVRLTRNALDQFSIHGARGFRKAFKKMLAELMEVYLEEGKEVVKESWWRATLKHVKLMDDTAARLLKYKPLLESATKLFLE